MNEVISIQIKNSSNFHIMMNSKFSYVHHLAPFDLNKMPCTVWFNKKEFSAMTAALCICHSPIHTSSTFHPGFNKMLSPNKNTCVKVNSILP